MSLAFVRLLWPVAFAVVFFATDVLAEQNLAPRFGGESTFVLGGQDCSDGVVKDDGTIESGYGWVPSVVDGRYVQRFEVAEFRSRKIEEVCICWTRTQEDDALSFTVQLYRESGGQPAGGPVASVEAVATLVPTFPDGAFYSIDVSDADMFASTDIFFLGVQWDASVDQFFFVCVDQSVETPEVDGFYIDNRAEDWVSVLESNDPIFDDHRAMMIRARAAEGFYPRVPALGFVGLGVFVALISCLGAALLYRRES